MRKVILCLFLVIFNSILYGQIKNERLTFILFIDNKLPVTDVTDGEILIKDSSGIKMDEIPFDFHVGGLLMSSLDYKKLFNINPKLRIFIKFKYKVFYPKYDEFLYESEIPVGWLNKEYIILKVYNKSDKINREKYVFGNGEKYLVQIMIPGSSSILKAKSK
jgi:hypothetical protein